MTANSEVKEDSINRKFSITDCNKGNQSKVSRPSDKMLYQPYASATEGNSKSGNSVPSQTQLFAQQLRWSWGGVVSPVIGFNAPVDEAMEMDQSQESSVSLSPIIQTETWPSPIVIVERVDIARETEEGNNKIADKYFTRELEKYIIIDIYDNKKRI